MSYNINVDIAKPLLFIDNIGTNKNIFNLLKGTLIILEPNLLSINIEPE